MNRKERRFVRICTVSAAAFVIAGAIVLKCPVSANNADFTASTASDDNFTAEDAEMPKNGKFERSTVSGMPCENREQFERWYETYESQTEEETADEVQVDQTVCEVPSSETEESTTVVETDNASTVLYSVDGCILNPELQTYLFRCLQNLGCEWMYEVCLCQLYQESRFNARAENRNGLDKGIAQLRITYFPTFAEQAGLVEYDIFNPIDSIFVYAYLTARNLELSNYDVNMALSRYYTGNDTYSAEYVQDVRKWADTIREVK